MSSHPSQASGGQRIAIAAAIDVVAVLAFVTIGRRSHHENGSVVVGALRVAAPFLIALAAGWLAARAWQRPMAMPTGITIWLVTIVGGMLLRRFAWNDGAAFPFIIVATLFTGCFLVGWRMLAEWRAERGGEQRGAAPDV
ncbi:MAG: DUF3054 domain-containing protein [Actinomycetota bacterium]|nr:DUF3054 domain-containing protein [Actinomycetota bacterium]